MPNRILKESVCTSETIDDLTPEEEVFFYRLIVNCDDYGRMDARETVLRSKLFPLRVDTVSNETVRHWLGRLTAVGLVQLYEVKGHPYVQILTWDNHQQVRAKRSRYPSMDEGEPMQGICNQLISDASSGNHPIAHVPVIQSNPIQSESESNPILEKAPRAPRKDLRGLFGAFERELGYRPETGTESRKWGTGLKELAEAGVTETDVPGLVAGYRQCFPGATCNPRAVAANLAQVKHPPKPNGKEADHGWEYLTPEESKAKREAQYKADLEYLATLEQQQSQSSSPSSRQTRTNGT